MYKKHTKLNSLEYSFIKSRLEVFYEKIPIQSVREFTARLNENKSIDFYISNAEGSLDLGQMLTSKDLRFGIKMNYIF